MEITSITLIKNADLPPLFKKNPSCRTWWGEGNLRVRDIGGWDGTNIRGPVGAREGRYDKKFVKWCAQHDVLFIRTVDLFWAFEYYRDGFYRRLSVSKLHKRWEEDKSWSRCTKVYVPTGHRDANGYPQFRLANPAELKQYGKERDPGPWKAYYRGHRAYFLKELARYEWVLKFWRECGQQARDSFLRCARYSNRQADAHPDYLVALRDRQGSVFDFGFVEVKGPHESLRPSQKRFFPELIRSARQKVWVARVPVRGNGVRFGQFTAVGAVCPCDTLQSKRRA